MDNNSRQSKTKIATIVQYMKDVHKSKVWFSGKSGLSVRSCDIDRRVSGCKMIQELGKTQTEGFDSVKSLPVWGFPKLNLLRQQDNMASTLRAKEKTRTSLSQKCVGASVLS